MGHIGAQRKDFVKKYREKRANKRGLYSFFWKLRESPNLLTL